MYLIQGTTCKVYCINSIKSVLTKNIYIEGNKKKHMYIGISTKIGISGHL